MRLELGLPACPTAYNGPDKTLLGRRLANIDGNHLPNTPKYQFNINFSQEFGFENGYKVIPYVKVNWRDKAYFDMLNSEFARNRAKGFAARLAIEAADSAKRLDLAFTLACGRVPLEDERAACEKFFNDQRSAYAKEKGADERAWTDLCQMLLASNSFLYME